jgi:hypothetical protein
MEVLGVLEETGNHRKHIFRREENRADHMVSNQNKCTSIANIVKNTRAPYCFSCAATIYKIVQVYQKYDKGETGTKVNVRQALNTTFGVIIHR